MVKSSPFWYLFSCSKGYIEKQFNIVQALFNILHGQSDGETDIMQRKENSVRKQKGET